MGCGPRLATGRARGQPLRSGPRGAGPWAPAPCPSAVEDAGLWGRWPGGRKPGGASWLVPGTGGARVLRRRWTGGAGGAPSVPRGRGGRAGAGARSRKPAERSAEARRPVGVRGPPRLAGDAALTPPRGCLAGCAHLRGRAGPPRDTIFRPRGACWRSRAGGGSAGTRQGWGLKDPRLWGECRVRGVSSCSARCEERSTPGWHDKNSVHTPHKICQVNTQVGGPRFEKSLFPHRHPHYKSNSFSSHSRQHKKCCDSTFSNDSHPPACHSVTIIANILVMSVNTTHFTCIVTSVDLIAHRNLKPCWYIGRLFPVGHITR